MCAYREFLFLVKLDIVEKMNETGIYTLLETTIVITDFLLCLSQNDFEEILSLARSVYI